LTFTFNNLILLILRNLLVFCIYTCIHNYIFAALPNRLYLYLWR